MTGAARRERLRAALHDVECDGLLVTHLPNIRYLTGFSGSNAVLFIGSGDPLDDVLATDGRYADQVRDQAPDLPALLDRATLAHLVASLAGHGIAHVAMESSATIGMREQVLGHLRAAEIMDGVVEGLRAVKDHAEIDALAAASRITADALDDVIAELRPGMSEVAVARRLEQRFGELGADDRAFATIVASGPNSAIPHHEPTARPLAEGDLVVIDCGAMVGGYHADMTRTLVLGAPAPWQEELHAAVLEAQQAATARALPGVGLREIDGVARAVLERHGLGASFTHGTGHGVGLEIHEAPMLSARALGTISASMVVTIEPGAYLPGRGGVRIEDTVLVAAEGPRVLTDADRTLRSA